MVKGIRLLKRSGLFLLILMVLILPACGVPFEGQAMQEPQLTVTAGDQAIRIIYYGDRYNETREEINKRLSQALEESLWEELPYIPLGEEITIKAENFSTEEFAVHDYILKKNGEIRYDEKLAQISELPAEQGAAAFELSSHPAVFLSSDSYDYEPGNVIRGFVIRADIDGASFAFAFIARTDAGKIE